MILVAGLSPAWQQILRFEHLRPGAVNRAGEVHQCASGKVLNVGVALAQLGANCETISVAGGWASGPLQRDFAAAGGVGHWITTAAATRICTTLLDDSSGQTTELVENAPALSTAELAEFRRVYAQLVTAADMVVLTGSLPAAAQDSFYRDLLRETRASAMLDVRGAELSCALECRPLLVKPNREELAATLGRPLERDADLHAAMEELHGRGAAWVLVTDGPRAAWIYSAEGRFRAMPPIVASLNPVGSGDCLTAGIAWAIASGKPMLEAIRVGIAATADNAAQLLPARIDVARVQHLLDEVQLERV